MTVALEDLQFYVLVTPVWKNKTSENTDKKVWRAFARTPIAFIMLCTPVPVGIYLIDNRQWRQRSATEEPVAKHGAPSYRKQHL